MTIEHFGIYAGYGLWAYILLCMGVKIVADRSKSVRAIQRAEWIRQTFLPAGENRTPVPLKKLLRCARSDVLLELIAGCYARSLASYGPGEQSELEQAVLEALLMRIEKADRADAFSRCVILRCIALSGLRSARIDQFLTDCAAGSPLEQMWVRAITEGRERVGAGADGASEERMDDVCS